MIFDSSMGIGDIGLSPRHVGIVEVATRRLSNVQTSISSMESTYDLYILRTAKAQVELIEDDL